MEMCTFLPKLLFLLLLLIASSQVSPNHKCHVRNGLKQGRPKPYGNPPNLLAEGGTTSTTSSAVTPSSSSSTMSTSTSTTPSATPNTTLSTTPVSIPEKCLHPLPISPDCSTQDPGMFAKFSPEVVPCLICQGPNTLMTGLRIFGKIISDGDVYRRSDLKRRDTTEPTMDCSDKEHQALICYNVNAQRAVLAQKNMCHDPQPGYSDGQSLISGVASYDGLEPGKQNLIVCVVYQQINGELWGTTPSRPQDFDWSKRVNDYNFAPRHGMYFHINP